MSERKLMALLLLIPLVFFISWVGMIKYMDYMAENHVKIAVRGYDPRNLLSGHYLNLELDWNATDCGQFVNRKCPRTKFKNVYQLFVPEERAAELDRTVRFNDNRYKIELLFNYRRGNQPRLKEMLIEGQPWRQWLAKQSESAAEPQS